MICTPYSSGWPVERGPGELPGAQSAPFSVKRDVLSSESRTLHAPNRRLGGKCSGLYGHIAATAAACGAQSGAAARESPGALTRFPTAVLPALSAPLHPPLPRSPPSAPVHRHTQPTRTTFRVLDSNGSTFGVPEGNYVLHHSRLRERQLAQCGRQGLFLKVSYECGTGIPIGTGAGRPRARDREKGLFRLAGGAMPADFPPILRPRGLKRLLLAGFTSNLALDLSPGPLALPPLARAWGETLFPAGPALGQGPCGGSSLVSSPVDRRSSRSTR